MGTAVLVVPWMLFFAGEAAINGRAALIVDWWAFGKERAMEGDVQRAFGRLDGTRSSAFALSDVVRRPMSMACMEPGFPAGPVREIMVRSYRPARKAGTSDPGDATIGIEFPDGTALGMIIPLGARDRLRFEKNRSACAAGGRLVFTRPSASSATINVRGD